MIQELLPGLVFERGAERGGGNTLKSLLSLSLSFLPAAPTVLGRGVWTHTHTPDGLLSPGAKGEQLRAIQGARWSLQGGARGFMLH